MYLRSPIVADDLSEHLDCGPFREKDRRHFKDFVNILDSNEFRKFIKVDKEFKEYPFYPPRLITTYFSHMMVYFMFLCHYLLLLDYLLLSCFFIWEGMRIFFY